ncbi:MAG: CDP-glucose 4,6-dehydratase [Spirochaetes bacterium]|nr:CDP-glucose 4,6-dehydratase [Spirochaetota bacterium]
MESMVVLMFNNFFKNKKVFITGHTGFKGSWLAFWLLTLGAKVKGYALEPNTQNDFFVVTQLEKKIESVIADVRDLNLLKKEMNDFNPDIVFHLAAQPLVRYSYQNPKLTFETNVLGTVNLFEAIRSCNNIQACINITTDKCYENVEKISGYIEDDKLGGHDPYSASKACSEIVSASYRKSFFSNSNIDDKQTMIATVRAGNVIGGGDWAKDRLIPDSIRALENNLPIDIRNPDAIRPWQYVLEPLSGYLWLAAQSEKNAKEFGGAWNFGPDIKNAISVNKIVDQVIKNWGKGKWSNIQNPNDLHEAKLLYLDCSKVKTKLNWLPSLDIESTITATIAWYKEYFTKKDNMFNFSLEQLETYIKKAQSLQLQWSN